MSAAETPIVIFGDHRNPALRHLLPIVLPSFPALYIELAGRRIAIADPLDAPRIRALGSLDEVLDFEQFGFDELLGAGATYREALAGAAARACRSLGVVEAAMPPETEAFISEALRADGVDLILDERRFESRRRDKTRGEIEGAERAQIAAQTALGRVREELRRSGDAPTSEDLRKLIAAELFEHDAMPADSIIVASGPATADPHEFGTGRILEGTPILVDIYPMDLASGCWGDLTRTLCVGEPPAELRRMHEDVRATQLAVMEAVGPGVTGHELNRIGRDHLAGLGYRTDPGDAGVSDGPAAVLHLIGHGVGLEIVEPPMLDVGGEELIAGDIVTVEPAVYRRGFGGCRIEDLIQVTEGGFRNLTDCPYDLTL